jgi:hypothetical protein
VKEVRRANELGLEYENCHSGMTYMPQWMRSNRDHYGRELPLRLPEMGWFKQEKGLVAIWLDG